MFIIVHNYSQWTPLPYVLRQVTAKGRFGGVFTYRYILKEILLSFKKIKITLFGQKHGNHMMIIK